MRLTGPIGEARGLLRTQLWLVVLATCVAAGAAFFAASQKPVAFTATAEVVVSPAQTKNVAPVAPDMGTERAIAESGIVVQHGAEALRVSEATVKRSLSVSVVVETRVLRISYRASKPADAYLGARLLAMSYVEYRSRPGTDEVVTLVTPPSLPASGTRGSLPLYLVLGLMAGLVVGIAAAWLWDRVSDRIRSAGELEHLTGLPIVARVPPWKDTSGPLPQGAASAPFAFIAARLASLSGNGSGRSIVVTSAGIGAGTTTVACGTAVALAAQGKRVVLISANHEGLLPEQVLGVTTFPGLSQLLSRSCPPERAMHPTDVPNLFVVPIGGSPGVGLELGDIRPVLERVGRRSYVVIDAPPVLVSADTLLLAHAADRVLLVGDLRTGTRTDARRALGLLGEVTDKLVGWVANVPPHRWHWPALSRAHRSASSNFPANAPGAPDEAAGPVTDLADDDSDRPDSEPDRPMPVAMKARPRPDRQPPGTPRTATRRRDGVRPVLAPDAAARRR
jgi:polysaccharide biosynthesis transport protein